MYYNWNVIVVIVKGICSTWTLIARRFAHQKNPFTDFKFFYILFLHVNPCIHHCFKNLFFFKSFLKFNIYNRSKLHRKRMKCLSARWLQLQWLLTFHTQKILVCFMNVLWKTYFIFFFKDQIVPILMEWSPATKKSGSRLLCML